MLRCKQVDRAGRSGSHSRSFQLKCLGEKLNGSLDALRNAVDLKGFEFLGIAEGTATSIAVPETDTERGSVSFKNTIHTCTLLYPPEHTGECLRGSVKRNGQRHIAGDNVGGQVR